MPLLARNGFRLVAKTRVGDIGSGVVYEYVWANFDNGTVNYKIPENPTKLNSDPRQRIVACI
jgi:hypothetical protein